MTSRVLVTGAAGFIGSHLCEQLLEGGREILCVDNFDAYYPASIKRSNIRDWVRAPGVRFEEVDIRDQDALYRLMSENRVDTVVHLAARAGVRPSFADPDLYVDVNVAGTLSVIRASARAKVTRLVVASSSSVYGQLDGAADESLSQCRPLSPYGATKLATEGLCSAYAGKAVPTIVALRLFSVYGPRQRPDMAINKFTADIAAGRQIEMYAGGESLRDYTYVSDIVDGIVAAMEAPVEGFQAINLGRGEPVLLKAMISLIEANIGRPAVIKPLPPQPGDPSQTCASISLARDTLGFDPQVTIRDGIERYVSWFRSNSLVSSVDR